MIAFCKQLDADFKTHKVLYEIQSRKKDGHELYQDYIDNQRKDEADFFKSYGTISEDLDKTLMLIIFDECADLRYFFILGKSGPGYIRRKASSISDELISAMVNGAKGTIFGSDSGLINWLSNEDVRLLLMDKENMSPMDENDEECKESFDQFIKLMKYARDHNLGFISTTHIQDDILSMLPNQRFRIDLSPEEFASMSMYKHERRS